MPKMNNLLEKKYISNTAGCWTTSKTQHAFVLFCLESYNRRFSKHDFCKWPMAKAAASPLQHQPSNKPILLIPEKRVRCMKTQHSEHTYTILHQTWCSAWQHNNSRNSIYFSLTAYKQSAFAIAAVVSNEKSIVSKTAQYIWVGITQIWRTVYSFI